MWTSPIIDRTIFDVGNRTAKGLFNVSDWVRIYNNTQYVRDSILDILSVNVSFPTIATPTTATIPDVDDFNSLLTCIDELREVAEEYFSIEMSAVFHAWQAGVDEPSFNYADVNLWENTLLVIYQELLVNSRLRHQITGVAITGADFTRNNSFRSY